MSEQTEEEIHEEFDRAVLGLVTKGLLEVIPGENGEEDTYKLTPAGLLAGAQIYPGPGDRHPGMWS